MRPMAAIAPAAAALALALGGCGGSHARPTITLPGLSPGSVSGAVVFARNCRSCHSLVGNESLHKQGGDLLGYNLTRAEMLSFTRVMPTRPLSAAQLDAVVDYVLRAQARGRR